MYEGGHQQYFRGFFGKLDNFECRYEIFLRWMKYFSLPRNDIPRYPVITLGHLWDPRDEATKDFLLSLTKSWWRARAGQADCWQAADTVAWSWADARLGFMIQNNQGSQDTAVGRWSTHQAGVALAARTQFQGPHSDCVQNIVNPKKCVPIIPYIHIWGESVKNLAEMDLREATLCTDKGMMMRGIN